MTPAPCWRPTKLKNGNSLPLLPAPDLKRVVGPVVQREATHEVLDGVNAGLRSRRGAGPVADLVELAAFRHEGVGERADGKERQLAGTPDQTTMQ